MGHRYIVAAVPLPWKRYPGYQRRCTPIVPLKLYRVMITIIIKAYIYTTSSQKYIRISTMYRGWCQWVEAGHICCNHAFVARDQSVMLPTSCALEISNKRHTRADTKMSIKIIYTLYYMHRTKENLGHLTSSIWISIQGRALSTKHQIQCDNRWCSKLSRVSHLFYWSPPYLRMHYYSSAIPMSWKR